MAGRKNKYTVDYFPHYCKGVDSKTMFILENKFGLIGYAVWYKTLELLGKSDNHYIDLREDTDMLFLISKLGITEEKFTEIYNLLAKLDAIDLELWNNKIVFSDNFVSNVEDAYVRRKGINVLHKLDLCKHLSINTTRKSPKERKGKENKVKDIIIKRKTIFSLEVYNCYNKILDYFPEHLHPKKEDSWLKTIKDLNEIEEIPLDNILEIVKKTRHSYFWAKNFLSLPKLRRKNKDGIMYIVYFNEQIKEVNKYDPAEELIRRYKEKQNG